MSDRAALPAGLRPDRKLKPGLNAFHVLVSLAMTGERYGDGRPRSPPDAESLVRWRVVRRPVWVGRVTPAGARTAPASVITRLQRSARGAGAWAAPSGGYASASVSSISVSQTQ